ncbi:MAG: MFS transporter [Prevotellaceae bacterium]|jgi:fucose permease|nr:MFS transporter [Prevotellaceae bacterium]
MTQQKTQNYVFPLIIMGVAFFVIGFAVGINGIMVPILEGTFQLSKVVAYLVSSAFFLAALVMGAPVGMLVKKIGYKKNMVTALFVMALGILLFIPSAKLSTSMAGFYMFLIASFIGGIGQTMLQASVNPYVTICGPIEKAAQRMCIMGIMNKSAWYLGPVFIGLFINLVNINITDVIFPFSLVAAIIAGLGVFIGFMRLPEIKAEGEETDSSAVETSSDPDIIAANQKTSIWQFPHLILGALALFIYVGVETLPMVSAIDYAKTIGLENPAGYSGIVPVGLVAGYIISIFVLQVMKQTNALVLFTVIALIASLCLIFLPAKTSIYCLAGLGFSHSLMWGAIWALAITKLGKFTKSGSSLMVVAIGGGAILPLIFAFLIDILKDSTMGAVAADYQHAYWIFVPCYLYILWYALSGHKIGLKKA